MEIVQAIIGFIIANIAYILVGVAVLYFTFFIYQVINSRKTGEGFTYSIRNFILMLIILGFAVYCLFTGTDIRTFIH